MREFPLVLAWWLRPSIVADLARQYNAGEYVITDADILREFQHVSAITGVRAPTTIEWVGDWYA
jgi:hypothetical protein